MFTNVFRNSQLNNMRVTRGKNKCLKKKKTFDQLKVQPLFLPINIENMSFGVKLELERALEFLSLEPLPDPLIILA